jgi:sulfonate transport system substrate-binding protein
MRVGGVPEHYNAPVHGVLPKVEKTEWVSFPSGTGAMLDALDGKEIDLAILLTEGVSKHALTTGSSKIVGTFVDNPLPWGVHVRPEGDLHSMSDLNARMGSLRFGISRMGSGSHLMAVVHAATLGAKTPQFKIVDTMKGARDAMVNNEIDVFLWDITTADVHAREGVWKCIGTVSGEWPAFVFATRSDINAETLTQVRTFIDALRNECEEMKENCPSSIQAIMDKYKISHAQASEFMRSIKWNSKTEITRPALLRVIDALQNAGIVPTDVAHVPESIAMERVCSFTV